MAARFIRLWAPEAHPDLPRRIAIGDGATPAEAADALATKTPAPYDQVVFPRELVLALEPGMEIEEPSEVVGWHRIRRAF